MDGLLEAAETGTGARRAQLKQLQDYAVLLLANGLGPEPRRLAPKGKPILSNAGGKPIPSNAFAEWFMRLGTGIKISASSRTHARTPQAIRALSVGT